MADLLPPPSYSQQDSVAPLAAPEQPLPAHDPQIVLLPTVDAVNFQKGYLGAEGERAAIEGEIQIKGIEPNRWNRVSVTLRTFERAYAREIELGFTEQDLYTRDVVQGNFPLSFPFSIPLMPDTPQSIQTTHSVLAHTLTALLHPVDPLQQPLRKSLSVHTRRYSSPGSSIAISPETYHFNEPTRVEVQVPRTSFTTGEDIPLYVTVPPPSRELVVDRGLRLRNIQAELVRIIKVKREREGQDEADSDSDVELPHPSDLAYPDQPQSSSSDPTPRAEYTQPSSSSKPPVSPDFSGSCYRTVVARSGASCRFHSSRPIQLRFLLHQTLTSSPSESRTDLPSAEVGRLESDAESALITQLTLLHNIAFHIKVFVSFVDTKTHTERISHIIVPIVVLPPPARLPQVPPTIDEAYSKKHDRPPSQTNRQEEYPSIPHYSEAGPSILSGAPPPFDDREAPPPFFATELEASTSTRLPTFQESENEIILPDTDPRANFPPVAPEIPGEGDIFGFPPSQQFDGHSEDMQRSNTPPPTLEMASHDTDLTSLADLHDSGHVTIEAMNLVLSEPQHDVDLDNGEQPPPPPPAMDDPSDPPPSIDSAFRSPEAMGQRPTTPPLPPYLVPGDDTHHHHHEHDQEHVNRPPPYVD
ncbi:hypothetical protein D9611_003314 [Ephemerocybe angulata]|uniref:Uncharacterized protein n=1 Tax=Ephemerocybe angulata TaxID=980116 RepID=A0A8H5CAU7_9AGAR|nr:hypothetical protein D9611_003314 [Tulosesus angulatus]